MRDLLIVLSAVVLVILSSAWWPAIGDCWVQLRWRLNSGRRQWVLPAWTGPGDPQTPVPVDDPDDDDDDAQDWADELHAINLATHRDRPVHQLTHYEIEAVIRDLGVPEWVPERWRVAA